MIQGLFHYDSNAVITNKAGSLGAYLASVLFGFFGHVAYLIPIAILVSVFLLFRSTKEQGGGINTGITIFGVFLALISGCGLATLLWPDSVLIYKAGGLLGLWIARTLVHILGDLGATLLLFSTFIAGITLFADIRWLKLIDKIGDGIMGFVDLIMGSSSSPKVATAGNDEVRISYADEVEINHKDKQPSSGSSGSMIGALGAGISGLFATREAKSDMSQAGFVNRDSNIDPLFSDDSIVPVQGRTKGKQEPVLGFPDHLASSSSPARANTGTAGNIKVQQHKDTDLGLEITTKNYLDDGYEQPSSSNSGGFDLPEMTVQGSRDQEPEVVPSGKLKLFGKKKASPTADKKVAKQATNNNIPVSLDKAISLPPISLLNPPPQNQGGHSKEVLEAHARNIVITLEHYGVRGVEIDCYYPGPIITRYELLLPPGTKVSKISGLSQDMARSMCVSSIRIVEVIPGKTTIGVEVPNETRDLVAISEILDSKVFRDAPSPLTMVLGKTISGKPAIADMGRMPHLLIAGTTGSGKSVGVNAMLISLLYKATPEEVKLILIDPKMLELSIYEGIPHLLTSVVTDMKDASNALRWAVGEMERRYALMSHLKVRNIAGYNAKVKEAIARGEPIMDPTFDPTTACRCYAEYSRAITVYCGGYRRIR
ncbi:DNA translocase FtsK [Nymphon striatum]|nr:DNA translocase FtsK [Nymphon striatum]